MDKEEAAKLLNLDAAANAAQVDARYRQICAFIRVDADTEAGLSELTARVQSQFDEAYHLLPHGAEAPKASSPQSEAVGEESNDLKAAVKAFIFPHPKDTAGEPFSDQWWKVYKRAVLLALAALALFLNQAPKLFNPALWRSTSPPAPPFTSPYERPVGPGDVEAPPGADSSSSLAPTTQQNKYYLVSHNGTREPSNLEAANGVLFRWS